MPIVRRQSQNDPALQWFPESRFGMFIHFGLYALLGRGEWVMYNDNIPRDEYEKLARRFNPRKFNAEEWVELAESAGARYITVTAKHHDGFCLFDSQLTDFKITNTPFRRDLIGELIAACQRRKMRIILYYSQPDWHHPNFVHRKGAFKDLDNPPATDQPDWSKYLQYLEGQIRELVTNYGRIDGIWFDGSHKSEQDWRGRHLYHLIKKHQPHAVVNDRARYGDFFTPERSLPDDLTDYLFEACESISPEEWGYKGNSSQFSVPHLIRSLVRMTAAGGNYLLNVGPKPDGTIQVEQAERMRVIGDWLRINGKAIYGTQTCSVVTDTQDILVTHRGHDIYLHLLQWPTTDRLVVPGVRALPSSAHYLAAKSKLNARLTSGGLRLEGLPASPADANVVVIHLRFPREPRLLLQKKAAPQPTVISLAHKRPTVLSVADAEIAGRGVKGIRLRVQAVDTNTTHQASRVGACINNWMTPDQSCVWRVESSRRRRYRVRVELRCAPLYAGSTFRIAGPIDAVEGVVPPTPRDGQDFQWLDLGILTLPAGQSKLALAPTYMPYGYIFAGVSAVCLTPVTRPDTR